MLFTICLVGKQQFADMWLKNVTCNPYYVDNFLCNDPEYTWCDILVSY